MGQFLQPAKSGGGLGFEVVLAGDTGLGDAVVLDVLPHPLVGVQFRRVAGQEEQLQPTLGSGDEFLGGPDR